MPEMTLAYALFVQCPRCGHHIDVGESSEEIGSEEARELASEQGKQAMQGICPSCHERVTVAVASVRSRARN